MAGNANKFEFIMNQDTSDSNDSVKQVANLEKSLHSSLITLAFIPSDLAIGASMNARKSEKLNDPFFILRPSKNMAE